MLVAEPIEAHLRDGLAWSVLALAAGLGTIAVFGSRVDPGIGLSTVEAGPGGRPAVLVASVAPWSEAAAAGLAAGMVVVELATRRTTSSIPIGSTSSSSTSASAPRAGSRSRTQRPLQGRGGGTKGRSDGIDFVASGAGLTSRFDSRAGSGMKSTGWFV